MKAILGRPRIFLLLACAVGLSVCSAVAWAAFSVTADKENVVAGRLEGEWQLHAELTRRLLGEERPAAQLAFKSAPEMAGKVPAKYEKFLDKKQIYMAGIVKLKGKEHPFILVEHKGNPHVVWFRERDGDPMGDAESANVMLAPAKDQANDLLFVGGDFNNQPFSAYERVKAAK